MKSLAVLAFLALGACAGRPSDLQYMTQDDAGCYWIAKPHEAPYRMMADGLPYCARDMAPGGRLYDKAVEK